jgi:hypothetical protein
MVVGECTAQNRAATSPRRGGFRRHPQRNNRFFINFSTSQIVSTTGMVSGASTA